MEAGWALDQANARLEDAACVYSFVECLKVFCGGSKIAISHGLVFSNRHARTFPCWARTRMRYDLPCFDNELETGRCRLTPPS